MCSSSTRKIPVASSDDDSKGFTPKRMPYGFMPAHPSLFLRREVYGQAGEYNRTFRIAADFELCCACSSRTKSPIGT